MRSQLRGLEFECERRRKSAQFGDGDNYWKRVGRVSFF